MAYTHTQKKPHAHTHEPMYACICTHTHKQCVLPYVINMNIHDLHIKFPFLALVCFTLDLESGMFLKGLCVENLVSQF